MPRTRRLLATGLAPALIACALAACGPTRDLRDCDDRVEKVEDPTNPLMSTSLMAERPDEHRDRLVASAATWPAPFGAVKAGVNYHYDQWLRLYGMPGGALALTKRNAPLTYLDEDDVEPVWALRPSTKRVAWDVSAEQFVLLSLPVDKPIQVDSFSLDDAKRRWCIRLESRFAEGDPLGTMVLPDESVVVAAKSGNSAEVARLGTAGGFRWKVSLPSVDRADFLGSFEDLLVIGGREDHHLASGQFPVPTGPSVTAVAAATGAVVWRYQPPRSALAHVLGVSAGRLLLLERGADGVRLVALRRDGTRGWVQRLDPTALQSALRGGVVLLKTRTHYVGRGTAKGELLWSWKIPTDHTFTPYGFTLGQLPALDDRRVLMPTTRDLRTLDVQTGRTESYPLPQDGINTTYWPYQLMVTDALLGVVTNTGAVVTGRTE